MPVELLSPVEKSKFDHERAACDDSLLLFYEPDRCASRPARCHQVIHDQIALTRFDDVRVDFEMIDTYSSSY